MRSMDVLVKRSLVIASIVIVLALSAVAVFSALDNAATDQAETDDQAPAPAGRAFPGARFRIDDAASPFSVGCFTAGNGEAGPSDVYMVVLENLGTTASPYLVAATLTDEEGRTQRIVIDIPSLAPGLEAEEFLVPDPDLGTLDRCDLTAVETNRRVVLLP